MTKSPIPPPNMGLTGALFGPGLQEAQEEKLRHDKVINAIIEKHRRNVASLYGVAIGCATILLLVATAVAVIHMIGTL